jgi:signal transduction histidine kinase
MAEEAITNAHRHSRASTLTVRIGCVDGDWVMVIVDDGVGFEFRGLWSLEKLMAAGLGPKVIRERVHSLGGNLMIESTATGARIEIRIPKDGNTVGMLLPNRRRH